MSDLSTQHILTALREVRGHLVVEYHEDGRVASVGHDSAALRKMVAILDAALSTPEPQTGDRDGDEAQKIREGLAKERHRGDGSLEGQINYLVASLVAWMRTARTVELAANADREALEAAERRLAEVEERAKEDAARLDWIEANPDAELAKIGGWDESNDYRWAVHVVHGGRNDREWHEIGSGETARAALDAALRAKPEAQAIMGKEGDQ